MLLYQKAWLLETICNVWNNEYMKLSPRLEHAVLVFWKSEHKIFFLYMALTAVVFIGSLVGLTIVFGVTSHQEAQQLRLTDKQKAEISKELSTLKNQDQYKRNETLEATISAIEKTYGQSVLLYQDILDLQAQKVDTTDDMKLFTDSLSFLSKRNYSSAAAQLAALEGSITSEQNKLAAANAPAVVQTSQPAQSSNTPPSNGYNVQLVNSDRGDFTVSIIAADMGSTKVVIDTASDSNCSDNCPTLPLSDYVSRSGAYAGINGTYFCPAEYPSCAGKTGSFDLLVMNKNKVYFNSDNNVYSTNPAVIFGNGFIRFVSQALQWGRDTSVDGVISNFPLLVSGGNIVYSDSSDAKFNNKGTRDFVAHKGNTVFIGVIYNANMTDSAHVLKALGMDDAMNLDEGGSTALWYGGYKAGPGRNIPNALLFIRK